MARQGEKIKVLFVNKFSPLSSAITGRSSHELADELRTAGLDVSFLCIKAKYRSVADVRKGDFDFPIQQIRSSYDGDSRFFRLCFSLLDGFRLFLSSCFIRKDVMIVMTDPPMLFLWFQCFRVFLRAKLVYWTMDIYPEAFVAGQLAKASNPFYKLLKKIIYWKAPDFLIALGEEQLKFLERNFKVNLPHAILPCGIIQQPFGDSANGHGKIKFSYSGNLGEAHDPNFLEELILQLDFSIHDLTLCLYGTKADTIRKKFEDHPHVQFKDSMSYKNIADVDVNIASLLPRWDHVCVPSKAVTAVCCGSALLLNSSASGDNWKMFSSAGWRIEPTEEYGKSIRQFLDQLSREAIQRKKERAQLLAQQCQQIMKTGFSNVITFIRSIKKG